MKQLIFALVFFLLLSFAVAIEATETGPLVRVLLGSYAQPITITSSGRFVVERREGSQNVQGNATATFQLSGNLVRWNEKGLTAAAQFMIKPAGRDFLFLGQRPYRGNLILMPIVGSIRVINELGLDDYIRGTMKLETNPSWPVEALKAQIVVSRTFALKNLARNEDDGFDFCATPLSQAYGGVNAEDPRTNRLIDETRNLILTYLGEPADSVYHSQSGGITEDAHYVWGSSVPYLISVPSPWETDAPYHSWEIKFSIDSLSTTLSLAGLSRGRIVDIETIHSENGGRVKTLVVHTDHGSFQMSAQRFREALGFQVLPSTFFELDHVTRSETIHREVLMEQPRQQTRSYDLSSIMEKDLSLDDIIDIIEIRQREREQKYPRLQRPEPLEIQRETVEITNLHELIFRGRGYGHGVGLSQWGARGMALVGYSCEEILLHYYPGCEVQRVRFR